LISKFLQTGGDTFSQYSCDIHVTEIAGP
jgi:hypothetical protein